MDAFGQEPGREGLLLLQRGINTRATDEIDVPCHTKGECSVGDRLGPSYHARHVVELRNA